ncbi:Alpha/Beta hydrolase protein [Echria macrotheca]|uniref:Carboxylic ester hydrolase n=1 Tax=Echria macrotheca TaxID=438768 RepID=A0AAJ0B6C2_9PEZI|nr:Alpha/Beta hydrolase protein [Echria macrotheca]
MLSALSCLALLLAVGATSSTAQELPVIDLGVSVHRAQLNATGGYYSFNNIPYAEPPLGPLRFRLPVPLVSINRTINDGTAPRRCFQISAPWFQYSLPLVFAKLAEGGITPPAGPPPSPPPGQSEDCLVLDVSVPKAVYDAKVAGTLNKPVPVMVWIHGGGYIEGSKSDIQPAGLLAESRRNGAPGIIFVAINYRLGMFGFPPRKPTMIDIASNAGLYDQRFALEWVRLNIGRFGGNPNAVTVIGESAGAGAVITQLTAFGGIDGTSPFQRAIIQSPYIKPALDAATYSMVYDQFLTTGNITSYAQARTLSSDQLAAINAAMILAAPAASTVFAPNVDGLFVPNYPYKLLAAGKVDRNVDVIVAHNLDEGLLFADSRVSNDTGFRAFLSGFMPSVPASKINTLATAIYPPDFSGSQPYTTQTGRVILAVAEAFLDCSSFGVNLAYRNQSRSYLFSIFPGMHAEDLSYTFNNGETANNLGVPVVASVVPIMQRWFVDFVVKGLAPGSAARDIPVYTSAANVVNITGTSFPVVRDPAANSRCRFWLDGLTS